MRFKSSLGKYCFFLVQIKLIFTWKVSLELVLQMKVRMTHFYQALCGFCFWTGNNSVLDVLENMSEVLMIWRVDVAAAISWL